MTISWQAELSPSYLKRKNCPLSAEQGTAADGSEVSRGRSGSRPQDMDGGQREGGGPDGGALQKQMCLGCRQPQTSLTSFGWMRCERALQLQLQLRLQLQFVYSISIINELLGIFVAYAKDAGC